MYWSSSNMYGGCLDYDASFSNITDDVTDCSLLGCGTWCHFEAWSMLSKIVAVNWTIFYGINRSPKWSTSLVNCKSILLVAAKKKNSLTAAANVVKTEWKNSCPHDQFTKTKLWESNHIAARRILGSLFFIFLFINDSSGRGSPSASSYSAKYSVLKWIPFELPVTSEPSRWCVHITCLMPWINNPNCF